MNKRYHFLLKNMGLMTISQFGTKILSFLLVPLYTSILTTAEYGTYDLYNTTVMLLMPILTLNISQSVMRFCLDKDADRKNVFSHGMSIFFEGLAVFFLLIFLNRWLGLIPALNEFVWLLILMYLTSALHEMFSCFARGINDVFAISVSGVLLTAFTLGLNILFLVPLGMGIRGYFLAHVISVGLATGYLALRTKFWKYVRFRPTNRQLRKQMVQYALPLILNSIAWWINSASDRYVVIALCGVAANGIYSVAYKIPNILNIFQNIFNQVWTLSAVKDYDKEDRSGFFAQIYSIYNFLMVMACAFIIAADRLLARFLFSGDFFAAWEYVPFLLIAVVFGALSGYVGGIFSAVKDSKVYAYSTTVGAMTNIVLNFVLIKLCGGPLGAAIATAISYFVVWVMRMLHLRKYIKLRIKLIRDCAAYGILVAQSVLLLWMRQDTLLLYGLQLALILVLIAMFLPELKAAAQTLKTKLLHKRQQGGDRQ